jgi:hypothetical protein
MRLTEPGDDVVVDGCEAKENFKPSEKRSDLRLESAALRWIERQRARASVADRPLLLRSDVR